MDDKVSAWDVYVHRETGREIRAKRMSAEDAAAQPGLAASFFKEGDYFVDDSAKIMLGELFDKSYEKLSQELYSWMVLTAT